MFALKPKKKKQVGCAKLLVIAMHEIWERIDHKNLPRFALKQEERKEANWIISQIF